MKQQIPPPRPVPRGASQATPRPTAPIHPQDLPAAVRQEVSGLGGALLGAAVGAIQRFVTTDESAAIKQALTLTDDMMGGQLSRATRLAKHLLAERRANPTTKDG